MSAFIGAGGGRHPYHPHQSPSSALILNTKITVPPCIIHPRAQLRSALAGLFLSFRGRYVFTARPGLFIRARARTFVQSTDVRAGEGDGRVVTEVKGGRAVQKSRAISENEIPGARNYISRRAAKNPRQL
jgi:hypothetical protein